MGSRIARMCRLLLAGKYGFESCSMHKHIQRFSIPCVMLDPKVSIPHAAGACPALIGRPLSADPSERALSF